MAEKLFISLVFGTYMYSVHVQYVFPFRNSLPINKNGKKEKTVPCATCLFYTFLIFYCYYFVYNLISGRNNNLLAFDNSYTSYNISSEGIKTGKSHFRSDGRRSMPPIYDRRTCGNIRRS